MYPTLQERIGATGREVGAFPGNFARIALEGIAQVYNGYFDKVHATAQEYGPLMGGVTEVEGLFVAAALSPLVIGVSGIRSAVMATGRAVNAFRTGSNR